MEYNLPQDIDRNLAEFLKTSAVIEPEQFDNAVTEINGSGSSIVGYMIKENMVTEDGIAKSIASLYGLKTVKLSLNNIQNRPLQDKVKPDFIKKNRMIPFEVNGGSVKVAIDDPSAMKNLSNMKLLTGLSVETFVTNISDFEQFMASLDPIEIIQEEVPPPPPGPVSTPFPVEADDDPIGNMAAVPGELGDMKKPTVSPNALNSGSAVIDFVDRVLQRAIDIGASDIHIEKYRSEARVRIRHNGTLQKIDEGDEFLRDNYSAVTTRVKILADLDISERRLPQDGGIAYPMAEKVVDIRVSVLPTTYGERIVMRILDPSAANFALDELGIPEKQLKDLRKAVHSPQGMVLVTGPTGSGKSTSLYAVLKELNDVGINILTAEDPVEFDLHGIGQVQVREKIGFGFAEALRSFLRQDPEVIMVGEIRDKETSDIAIKAALTGHLVLSTLHTNDAPSTITRMVNMGLPPYLITGALSCVVAQRLSRITCEHCKEEVTDIPPEKLVDIGFDKAEAKKIKLYRGKGCDKCMDTGVKGRRGIYEILPVTDGVKEAIMNGASELDIRAAAAKEGFVTMQEIGRDFIREGLITIEEYQRILMLD